MDGLEHRRFCSSLLGEPNDFFCYQSLNQTFTFYILVLYFFISGLGANNSFQSTLSFFCFYIGFFYPVRQEMMPEAFLYF